MGNLNKAMVIGRLGKKPEMRYAPTGRAVTTFSVAINRTWKNESGEKQEATDWVNVEAWGATAENCARYLDKGSQVYVEGRIQTDKYEKDGQTHYATKVVAENVQFLDNRKSAGEAEAEPEAPF